jgi:hypothetical protein
LIGPKKIADKALIKHKRKMRTENICESRIQLCVKSKEASKSTASLLRNKLCKHKRCCSC